MHQKEEYVFPVAVVNQRNLSKNASFAANTKNNKWRCPIVISLVSVNSIFLKMEDFRCVFKNGLTFKSFFFEEEDTLILKDWRSFVLKNINKAHIYHFSPCTDAS